MEDCIFCKLVAGEIPSYTVYEDEYFKGILDISPCARGHCILIAKEHAANVFELPEEVAKDGFVAAKKLAIAIKKAFNCDGVNILQNNGEAAGQTVFHFHIHVFPRYNNDTVNISYEHKEITDFETVQKEITDQL